MRAALLLALGLCACKAGEPSPRPADPPSTPARAAAPEAPAAPVAPTGGRWALVRELASDAYEGRAPGTPGGLKARALLKARLEACGYAVTEQATAGPGTNLLAIRPGDVGAKRWVLLSAHYDHLGVVDGAIMNGADDNAAAVGSVLEVACARPKSERAEQAPALLVALWDSEEPPHFLTDAMGSAHFVAHPTVPLATIDVAIVLDLVGHGLWPGFPAHVALGAETSPELAAALAKTPVPAGLEVVDAGLHLVEELVATGSHQPWSDYDAFRDAGVPVLFLSNGQSHRYHTPADDFESLDLPKLGLQTDWLGGLVGTLLAAEKKPRFAPADRPEVDRRAATRLVEGALVFARSGREGAERFDVAALEADLTRLREDASALTARRATQRVQCFAAGHYPQRVCASF